MAICKLSIQGGKLMTRYRDQQTTIFSELCSLIENDTSCVYDILDTLIFNLNQEQLDMMEDVIVNHYGVE